MLRVFALRVVSVPSAIVNGQKRREPRKLRTSNEASALLRRYAGVNIS
jgi:hypothetical protein